MPRFGWMRLACLFLVLTVLAALIRLGDGGAEAWSLAARVPDTVFVASEQPEPPAVTRWTEDQISSLENIGDDALRTDDGPEPAEPPPRPAPASGNTEQRPPTKEKARAVSAAESPVFYRPADTATDAGSGPVCGDLRGAPEGGKIVFPLERQFFYSYEDTWGAPRTQGGHEGTDLMTPTGVPEYAITDGTVVPVAGSDADGWNTLGGHAVMVRADYSIGPVKAGDLFYYAHLERESPLEIGTRVRAGQVVGYAGDTGQGPPGTSGLFPPHLHLGWYDGTGDRQDADSGAMNPYPLLEWIKSNGGAVSGNSNARFCEAPRTGPPTPSSHDDPWPTPSDPGVSPDLDTGSNDPKPARATGDGENDRDKKSSPKKPPYPNDPNGPKKDRDKTPPKRPDSDRSQGPKHHRPDKDPQRSTRPEPGEDQQPQPKPEPPDKDPPPRDSRELDTPNTEPSEENPPKPAPPPRDLPEKDPPPQDSTGLGQYDPSTGESAGQAERSSPKPDRESEADRNPTADENTSSDLQKPPPRKVSSNNTTDHYPKTADSPASTGIPPNPLEEPTRHRTQPDDEQSHRVSAPTKKAES